MEGSSTNLKGGGRGESIGASEFSLESLVGVEVSGSLSERKERDESKLLMSVINEVETKLLLASRVSTFYNGKIQYLMAQ